MHERLRSGDCGGRELLQPASLPVTTPGLPSRAGGMGQRGLTPSGKGSSGPQFAGSFEVLTRKISFFCASVM